MLLFFFFPSSREVEQSEEIQPFLIMNQTGIPITYTISGGDARTYKLSPEQQKPLVFKTNGKKRDSSWTQRVESVNKTLSVTLQDNSTYRYEKTDHGLPIDRVGKYKLHVTNRREKDRPLQVATFEVSSHKGDKILKIRSNILFINKTSEAISLLFCSRNQDKDQMVDIQSGATVPAPIHFTEDGSVQFLHNGAM